MSERDPDVLARQREREAALHAETHVTIERRLDDHAGKIGALEGEQVLVRERLKHGSASMDAARKENEAQRDEAKADRAAFKEELGALRSEIKPKPMATWVKAVGGAVSLGLVMAIVSLIVFIARLPSGEDVKAVRVGVAGDVERARSAAQAVEVKQAELKGALGGELGVIQAAQVTQTLATQEVVRKIEKLDELIRQTPGKDTKQ